MDSFLKNIQIINEKIDSLEYRERLLVLATLIVGVFMVWDWLLFQNQLQSRNEFKESIRALENQVVTESKLRQQIETQLLTDSSVREKQRLDRYRREIKMLDTDLKEKTVEFISPRQMIQILENLIRRESGLELLSLRSLKPETPFLDEMAEEDAVEDESLVMYLHGVEMNFRGDYLSVLNYVKRLESLKWRFEWDSVAITVDDYPNAKVRVKLKTLSFREGWIGV